MCIFYHLQKPPSSIPKYNHYWTSMHVLQRYYGVRSSRVMCFILTNMITPYRLCNTCLGYTVLKSCGIFNNIILNLSHFLHELRLSPLFYWKLFQIQFWRARGEQVSPSDRRSGVKLNGILFPSFSLLTVGYRSSFHTSRHYFSPRWSKQSLRWREISLLTVGNGGTFSLLTVGNTDNFKYGFGGEESRDRGSGGVNFILEKTITSPGIHLTTYYLHSFTPPHKKVRFLQAY